MRMERIEGDDGIVVGEVFVAKGTRAVPGFRGLTKNRFLVKNKLGARNTPPYNGLMGSRGSASGRLRRDRRKIFLKRVQSLGSVTLEVLFFKFLENENGE
jgi:hypothetical protein